MPTYLYRCKKCKHRFELFHGITDERPKRCPRCRGRAERVPAGGVGILFFKGSGFHVTDYRSRSYKEQAKREKSGGPSKGPAAGSPGKAAGGPAGGGGSASSGA
jgi:putative FmdB family regulatory protein